MHLDEINCEEISARSSETKGDIAEVYLKSKRFTQQIECASKQAGIEARQYELMAVISRWNQHQPRTIRNVSRALGIRHNSAVELVDRAAERGAIARVRDSVDRRQVLLQLTPKGEELLATISYSVAHNGNGAALAATA